MLRLGIDIGTTKVSAVIVADDLSVHEHASRDHNAALPLGGGLAEQDFGKIESATRAALDALPAALLARVVSVGLSSQMHSVVRGRRDGTVSTVVTWQDRRTEGEVGEMSALCGHALFPGYGGATLAHDARRGELADWDWAGTPADELARRLVGADSVSAMDPTLAAPWGLYDAVHHDWDRAAAARLGVPERFFPRIVESGTVVGLTAGGFGALPAGIPVLAPIGDNQASVLGSGGDPATDLFATVGTGSQLSAVVSEEDAAKIEPVPGLDFRPFPGGKVLVAVPPLSGGHAWALLAEAVSGVLAAFGTASVPEKQMLDRLDEMAALAAPDAGGLRIAPDFYGTRVHPGSFGSIDGITASNFTLPNVARALANGLVANLFSPMPRAVVESKRRILGSGNGLAKCRAMRQAVAEACPLPLVMPGRREEAATGAALLPVFLKWAAS